MRSILVACRIVAGAMLVFAGVTAVGAQQEPTGIPPVPDPCVFEPKPGDPNTVLLMDDSETTETIPLPDALTYDGDGHTITAVDPENDNFRGAVLRAQSVDGATAVKNFTITTRNLKVACNPPDNDNLLTGILFEETDGRIVNNRIIDLRQQTAEGETSGCQEGDAIVVVGRSRVTIADNVLIRYQKTGVIASGDGARVEIRQNTIRGIGPSQVIAQNGIQVSFKADATIGGNVVSNNGPYTPPSGNPDDDFDSAGIILFRAGQVRLLPNDLSNNERDIIRFPRRDRDARVAATDAPAPSPER